MANKPILIVGAGISGLVLAQSLRKANIPFRIFERDEGPDARPQGWALSLSWILRDLTAAMPTDLSPLNQASVLYGLHEEATSCTHSSAPHKLVRTTGSASTYSADFMLRVNRKNFRAWLWTHIAIEWGKRFVRYTSHDDSITVEFADGTSAVGSFLVGADGANSLVRSQLLPLTMLTRLPVCAIIGESTLPRAAYERTMALGTVYHAVLGVDFRLVELIRSIAPDRSAAECYWVVNWIDAAGETWLPSATQERRLEIVMEKIVDVEEDFKLAVSATEVEGICQDIPTRDVVPEALPEGRVVLVGDAWHAMTYFRGDGGNHAMQDALELGALVRSEDAFARHLEGEMDWERVVREYCGGALGRVTKAVFENRRIGLELSGAGKEMIEEFCGGGEVEGCVGERGGENLVRWDG